MTLQKTGVLGSSMGGLIGRKGVAFPSDAFLPPWGIHLIQITQQALLHGFCSQRQCCRKILGFPAIVCQIE